MELGAARLCAVKQILPGLAGEARFSDMLVHEAKLAARLNHANVVQVFDLGRDGDRLFIAMEYVEGFDLNALLRRCSRAKVPLPVELGIHVVRETLRGLDYAHRCSDDAGRPLEIVHRDVSPSNLLLSFDGEVKVCDFGIARANETIAVGWAEEELDEALRGKASYMSPEHARGESIDARADVFATGIVLWELAAGRRMYRTGDGLPSLLEQARRADVPELPPMGLPEEGRLRAILSKSLAPDRRDRYASASAMLRDLDDYAVQARLMTSPLQLGEWQSRTFGEEIIERRRSRERAIAAMQKGALVTLEPLSEPELASEHVAPATVDSTPSAQPRALVKRARSSIVATAAAVAVVVLVLAGAVMAIAMR
jgi:serine/threonine-protein kinase